MQVGNSSKTGQSQQQQQQQQAQNNGVVPKVVGPNVKGHREEYQLVRRLQSALFGGVYEAKGLSTGRDFAIKVLHKSELAKAQESNSIEFCEAPLSELRFAELMRGHEHVMEAEEHFEDAYCYYVVFDLCRGGDLLEALKQKPHGFDEQHAQFLIRQAALGLQYLHKRQVAMQDVSLENMLLHVNESNGQYQVKICDPGQAVVFSLDQEDKELPVNFRGLVGKSFRPPELHDQQPYLSTKVDSWCLGWSTFYLLTAQPLFMSADPSQQDSDWLLFQQGDFASLFQQKSNICSQVGLDFIFRLLQIEPRRRMSIDDALNHAWLSDPKVCPVMAPKELLPPPPEGTKARAAEAVREEAPAKEAKVQEASGVRSPGLAGSGGSGAIPSGGGSPQGFAGNTGSGTSLTSQPGGSVAWSSPWTPSGSQAYGAPRTPMLRVRSPQRSIRSGPGGVARISDPQRHGSHIRAGYVVATAHSPPPAGAQTSSSMHAGRAAARAASPLQTPSSAYAPTAMYRTASPHMYSDTSPKFSQDHPSFHTPRSTSRQSPTSGGLPVAGSGGPQPADDGRQRGRAPAWTFRSDGVAADGGAHHRAISPHGATPAPVMLPPRTSSGAWVPHHGGRPAQSPARSSVCFPRSPSPGQASYAHATAIRAPSPGLGMPVVESLGFSWSQAQATLSPRAGPSVAFPRAASPVAARAFAQTGFAWSPDPPSPRTSPRSFSPAVMKAAPLQSNTLPRWVGS